MSRIRLVPKEIQTLRARLDTRLAALEAALADPHQHASLEQIILDLARVAADEADASARQASVDAQRNVEAALDAARAEAQAALDAERASAEALRQAMDQAQATLQADRTEHAAREADLAAAREALERERLSHDRLLTHLQDAQAALDAERAAAGALRHDLEQAQATLTGAQNAGADRDRDLAAVRQALEDAQAARQADRAAGEAHVREMAAAQQAIERELKNEQQTSEQLRREVEAGRQAVEARGAGAQADLDRALKDAEARAEAAMRERRDLASELDAVRVAAAADKQDARARYEELRDATEKQIAGLELAARYAEARVPAAPSDVERPRPEDEQWESLEVEITEEVEVAPEPAPVMTAPPVVAPPVAAAPAPPAPVEATQEYRGPARIAKRVVMADDALIQIDGGPGKIIDLSTTGAQILSPGPLKPNRVVTLKLQAGETLAAFKGKVMWSRLEPSRGGQLWYRAGISFTSSNQAALQTFLDSRSTKR